MLKTLAEKASMKPLKCRYFNFLGVFPYFIKGVLSQGTTFSGTLKEGDSKLYNIASVLLAPIEKVFPPLLGLSSLIILEKSK
ncbi:MAG: hypothetical protein LBD73_02335 [Deferribacteraceae bacterium]|jgi:hypothetical protein|nr:hypothetical protein [Deferribacteraceae bacterium]